MLIIIPIACMVLIGLIVLLVWLLKSRVQPAANIETNFSETNSIHVPNDNDPFSEVVPVVPRHKGVFYERSFMDDKSNITAKDVNIGQIAPIQTFSKK